MHATLIRLFRYKAWADDELLTALADLGEDSPVTALAIKAMSHVHVVDRIFAAHLRRQTHGYASPNLGELPALSTLAADLRASDREYIDYVAALDRDPLDERFDFRFTDGTPGCMSREEMLLHLITHGAGHRGQISALMLLHSITPLKDGFTTWLHRIETPARTHAPVVSRERSWEALFWVPRTE